MSAAENECREGDLRVYADPGDFALFQALFPDSMRRLRAYIDRTDCRARAVVVLPDLAPDDRRAVPYRGRSSTVWSSSRESRVQRPSWR